MSLPDIQQTDWFESEVKPHEAVLRAYLFKHVPQPVDVDDVVQETYSRILKVRERKEIKSPRGLLFAIARNAATDLFRKKTTSRTIFVTEIDEFRVLDNAQEPGDSLNRSDERALLNEAIQSLPTRCREVLVLRKLENLSHKEIAARLSISVHTVESQLTKGLKRCQKFFRRKGLL